MTNGQLILLAAAVLLVILVVRQPGQGSGLHRILRGALVLWAVAFPVVSCVPAFAAGGSPASGGLSSAFVGATLLVPWLVGLIVLGVLVWATR